MLLKTERSESLFLWKTIYHVIIICLRQCRGANTERLSWRTPHCRFGLELRTTSVTPKAEADETIKLSERQNRGAVLVEYSRRRKRWWKAQVQPVLTEKWRHGKESSGAAGPAIKRPGTPRLISLRPAIIQSTTSPFTAWKYSLWPSISTVSRNLLLK